MSGRVFLSAARLALWAAVRCGTLARWHAGSATLLSSAGLLSLCIESTFCWQLGLMSLETKVHFSIEANLEETENNEYVLWTLISHKDASPRQG